MRYSTGWVALLAVLAVSTAGCNSKHEVASGTGASPEPSPAASTSAAASPSASASPMPSRKPSPSAAAKSAAPAIAGVNSAAAFGAPQKVYDGNCQHTEVVLDSAGGAHGFGTCQEPDNSENLCYFQSSSTGASWQRTKLDSSHGFNVKAVADDGQYTYALVGYDIGGLWLVQHSRAGSTTYTTLASQKTPVGQAAVVAQDGKWWAVYNSGNYFYEWKTMGTPQHGTKLGLLGLSPKLAVLSPTSVALVGVTDPPPGYGGEAEYGRVSLRIVNDLSLGAPRFFNTDGKPFGLNPNVLAHDGDISVAWEIGGGNSGRTVEYAESSNGYVIKHFSPHVGMFHDNNIPDRVPYLASSAGRTLVGFTRVMGNGGQGQGEAHVAELYDGSWSEADYTNGTNNDAQLVGMGSRGGVGQIALLQQSGYPKNDFVVIRSQ